MIEQVFDSIDSRAGREAGTNGAPDLGNSVGGSLWYPVQVSVFTIE